MNRTGALAAAVLLAGPLGPAVFAVPAPVAAPQLLQHSPLRHGEARGRVLSPSGEPLAGADIALAPLSEGLMGRSDLDGSRWLESQDEFELIERTTTGADGRFVLAPSPVGPDARIDGLYLGVEWVLFISAPQCRPVAGPGPSIGASLDVGDVRLESGGGLRGRIVGEQGQPFAGAKVAVSSSWDGDGHGYLVPGAARDTFSTRTDADGRFEFPSVRAEPLQLHISHPGATGTRSESVDAPKAGTVADVGELLLRRGGLIAGRVVDAGGEPVAGARIYVGDGSLSINRTQTADPILAAREALAHGDCWFTDEQGGFTAQGVPGPSAHLLVLAPGCDGALLRCVPANVEDLEITLGLEGRLLLQVTNSVNDEVISGAEVIAVRTGGKGFGGRSLGLPVRRLGEDDETLIEVGQVGPALHFVQVTAPGFAPAWIEPDGVAPGKFRLVPVALRPAALLEGLVTDTDDRPLAGAKVSAMNVQALFGADFLVVPGRSARVPIRDRGLAQTRTGADGRFTFSELAPALWTLEVALDGYSTGEDAVGSLSYGSTRTTLVRLRRAEPTAPAAPAEPGQAPSWLKPTAADAASGGAAATAEVLMVRGRVHSDGKPVAGAGVWAELAGSSSLLRPTGKVPGSLGAEGTDYHDRSEDTMAKVRCDRDGVYELRLPKGGEWRLCAASPQGGLLLEPRIVSTPADASEPAVSDLALGSRRATITVLDEADGRPLVGCWVWIDPGPVHWLAPNAWRTDARGRVELAHLQPGSYLAWAAFDQAQSNEEEPPEDTARRSTSFLVTEAADASVEIRVPRGLSLEGEVRSAEGTPVPDGTPVIVQLYGVDSVTVRTIDGRFAASGLQPGVWRVFVSESGDVWTSDVVLGEAQVDLSAGAPASGPAQCELELSFPGAKPYRRELTRTEYYAPTAFDSVKWKDKQLVGEGVRIRMIDDLLARHDLVGMARAEVLELLGPPGKRFTEEPVLTWYLGDERSAFAMDSEWLSLTLGADDRVTEERVWAD